MALGLGMGLWTATIRPPRGPQIRNSGITPITELSESGDAVTTHSVANLGDLTVASWALTEGDTVFSIDSSGNVTLDDLTGVSTDQTYTVQATLSDDPATVLTLEVGVRFDYFYLVDDDGYALIDDDEYALIA